MDRLISKKLLLDGRVPKRLKKRIIETLTDSAKGMFRWVAMSLETLQQIKFRPDFEEALGQLPSKLSELYEIIHSEIARTPTYGRHVATNALKWLLCAQRLLTVEELAAAIKLPYNGNVDSSLGSDDGDETDDDTDDQAIHSSSSSDENNQKDIETKAWIEDNIIRLCRNFVVVDSERKVFRFPHQSVREYLMTRKEYTDIEQHALVVERCLEIYEVKTSPGPTEPNLTRQDEILKSYARGYWLVHYKHLDDLGSQESKSRLRNFMIPDSTRSSPYMQWVADAIVGFEIKDKSNPVGWIISSLDLEGEDPLAQRLAYALAEPHTSLSMICAFGLSSMLNELDFLLVDLNQQLKSERTSEPLYGVNYEYTTPLTIASEQGHAQVVRRLLDKGATINISDELCRPPLLAAISHKNQNIVQMLLENGADIKTKCNINAWWVAYEVHSEHILKLLLEHGADVNALNSDGESALLRASEWGQELIVRFLLEQKADVNVMNLSGGNVLHYATVNDHLPVVQLLLEHGTDVNARDEFNRTSLHWALRDNHESIAQILLQCGADVNARDEWKLTILHYASHNGLESVARMLIERGADVNARDINSETSLHLASENGHESIVQLLVESGAEINARDENNRTPLHLASEHKHKSVIQMLLESETEVDARDINSETSFYISLQKMGINQ